MARIALDNGGVRVEIEPGLGAGIARMSWRGMDLMRPALEGCRWFNDMACYLLAPWSNRIAGGRFEWAGVRLDVRPDWADGTAIHGLVKDRPWSIEQRSPVSAVMACRVEDGEFPWAFTARVEYELGEDSLRTKLEVRNDGGAPPTTPRSTPTTLDDPMPAGLGFHPFWLRALDGGDDEAVVRVAGLRRYPCEGMIPTGQAREDEVTRALGTATSQSSGRPPRHEGLGPPHAVVDGATEGAAGLDVGSVKLDDVFAGSAHGAEILWRRAGVRAVYRCSEELGHTVVYTGMEGSFCLEPVTMVNDGFNMESRGCAGTGVVSLARGETLSAEWVVEVGRL